MPFIDERWIADLEEIRNWAGEERFLLAGGSYGGFIAFEYTLAHPQRVTAVILRDTWAFGSRRTIRAMSNVRIWSGTLRDNADFATAVADSIPIYVVKKLDGIPVPNSGAFKAAKMRYRYETSNAAFSYNIPRFDVRSRLPEIRVPTLVVVGRHDPITLVEDAEIHACIGGSVLTIFENSDHSPPSEEREMLQERVWEF